MAAVVMMMMTMMMMTMMVIVRGEVSSGQEQVVAVQQLLVRVVPQWASSFQLQLISVTGNDQFGISNGADGKSIVLSGNSGVSLASALNWYLKYYVNCSISWGWNGSGNQLNLPPTLPRLDAPVIVTSPVKYRYYMNVCTVSYSMAWWDWTRWEQEIDWMAMNGINLALSFTGQEYIWSKLWEDFGLTQDQVGFTGPAFLAWNRMGNVNGWASPLPQDWQTAQKNLQRQILQRQRSLGITSVLPCFAGHVPPWLQKLYPQLNITLSTQWADFAPEYADTYLLDPVDPMFSKIGAKFIELLIGEFGTDHVYNCDTFNEMDPSSNNSEYLQEASGAVIQAIKRTDPSGIWLMQGWLFLSQFWNNETVKAYLSGVSNDDMIILDLWSEYYPIWNRYDSYFGKPFIWCMLHNFGGNRALYGNLTAITTGPVAAKNTPGNSMVGTGLTMEAIEQNPVVYELMNEMGWRKQAVDLSQWIQQYATRRYGGDSTAANNAWQLLLANQYTQYFGYYGPYEYVPSVDMKTGGFGYTTLVSSWAEMLKAADEYAVLANPYLYDLVDITQQALINLFTDSYRLLNASCVESRSSSIKNIGAAMLELIDDLESILATDVNYLLGQWTERARSWATESSDEADLLEYNALNQVTLWGPNGEINDYAAKHWSGLTQYYKMRWAFFIDTYINASESNVTVNVKKYLGDILELEQNWGIHNQNQTFPTTPINDTLLVSKALYNKYATPSTTQPYHVVQNTDCPGNDIVRVLSGTPAQLMWLCSLDPACEAVNSDGFVKRNCADQISQTGVALYVKQEL